MMLFMSLFTLIVRPYRSNSTNLIAILMLSAVTLQTYFIGGVVKEYEMAFFMDKFLLEITSILNGFIWFLVCMVFLYIILSQGKWPTTAKSIHELTENQDLAIYHVKEARQF